MGSNVSNATIRYPTVGEMPESISVIVEEDTSATIMSAKITLVITQISIHFSIFFLPSLLFIIIYHLLFTFIDSFKNIFSNALFSVFPLITIELLKDLKFILQLIKVFL